MDQATLLPTTWTSQELLGMEAAAETADLRAQPGATCRLSAPTSSSGNAWPARIRRGEAVSAQTLREGLRHWATGVAVITSRQGETEHGMTVNSFTSISLEPPLVMVALDRATRTRALVAQAGCFGVTVLSATQQPIAERFAGREPQSGQRFEAIATQRLVSGAPFITGGLLFLDCQVRVSYELGTHTLVLGEVIALQSRDDPSLIPLLYFNRVFRQLAP